MKSVFSIPAILLALVAPLVFGLPEAKAAQASVVPLPPDLAGLPTITAEPWLLIDPNPSVTLEGPSFDRQGNLFVTTVRNPGRVLKVTPQKQVTVVFESKEVETDGSAIHKDGRIFVACLTGQLLSMNPDGSNVTFAKPTYEGKPLRMNDLVFDGKGNIFVSDFTGNITDPTGGVYYVSSDGTSVRPVLQHLCCPNGVSLSPSGKTLWVAETSRSGIIRADLQADGVTPVANQGVSYPYHTTGRSGPDSNRVDAEGNLYQAMNGQGRIVILNDRGIPIANVVVPGRDEGKYLSLTNLAIKPGAKEAYITAGGEGGATIFRFEALAPGLTLFSHQP